MPQPARATASITQKCPTQTRGSPQYDVSVVLPPINLSRTYFSRYHPLLLSRHECALNLPIVV